MDVPLQPIAPETEALLQQWDGPLAITGKQGQYVVMRADVYSSMLGMSDGDESETMASIRRGLADLDSGRTQDLDEAFNELDSRDEL